MQNSTFRQHTQPEVHDYILEHIPGAVNLPWNRVMDRRNPCLLKPDDRIRRIVQRVGASPDRTIIVYCATGRESTNLFLLFKWYLNYPNVRSFEGSFAENPTILGTAPSSLWHGRPAQNSGRSRWIMVCWCGRPKTTRQKVEKAGKLVSVPSRLP